MHTAAQRRIRVEELRELRDVPGADRRECIDDARRSLPLSLVDGANALDGGDELAPRLEAVLARDDDMRVVRAARHVGRRPAQGLLVAGGDSCAKLLDALLVERDRVQPDPCDRPLPGCGDGCGLELRPGPVAVLHGDHVLCVAQLEPVAGARAEDCARACDRLRLAPAMRSDERLRIFPVPLEIHDCSLREARRPLPRAEERSSARSVVHALARGGSVPTRGPDAPSRADRSLRRAGATPQRPSRSGRRCRRRGTRAACRRWRRATPRAGRRVGRCR